MRVSGGGGRATRAREGAGTARRADAGARAERFADALRKASRAGARGVAPGAEPAPQAPVARRRAADGKDAVLSERRETFREEERTVASPRPGVAATAAPEPTPAALPELRALVRALPVAVDASRLRDGAPLAISFGRSLDVELRPSPAGLELVLRPEARLARACQAELPGVVAALAARGLAVARAEVRARGAPHGDAAGPRVDLQTGLR